ncbi:MAG: type IX secretion system membrane protein PorP/SprF [Saprospirales bacterium]|nr:MAG: type IX secretion system membrane protein PorP/SprF [Saprospirales bacterium]
MRKKTKRGVSYLILCFWAVSLFYFYSPSAQAQDHIYSQYYKVPEAINPAFSGISENGRIGAAFRSQWSGFENAYRTYSLGYNQYFRRINSGFGLLAMVDNQGDGILTQSKVSAFYSYRIHINSKTFIQSGIEIGGVQSRLDWSKLVFGNQIDPILGPIGQGQAGGDGQRTSEDSKTYLDIGFGLLFSSPSFFAGFGLKHLNNANVGFLDNPGPSGARYPVLYSLLIGTDFQVFSNDQNRLKPNLLFAGQKDLYQLNVGLHYTFGQWSSGLYYRHNSSFSDAVQVHFGFNFENFSFGYSFDFTLSKLADHTKGAHEFTLLLQIDNNGNRRNVNYSDCLNLFRH